MRKGRFIIIIIVLSALLFGCVPTDSQPENTSTPEQSTTGGVQKPADNINVKENSGSWYRETGSGMGATLNVAAGMSAYTLTDRATWLAFKNRANLKILSADDPLLFNQYGVILVSPKKHPHVKSKLGNTFINWLTGKDGQSAIAAYKLKGKQLFFPNASH